MSGYVGALRDWVMDNPRVFAALAYLAYVAIAYVALCWPRRPGGRY